jgi:hypothetical protein
MNPFKIEHSAAQPGRSGNKSPYTTLNCHLELSMRETDLFPKAGRLIKLFRLLRFYNPVLFFGRGPCKYALVNHLRFPGAPSHCRPRFVAGDFCVPALLISICSAALVICKEDRFYQIELVTDFLFFSIKALRHCPPVQSS